ncbi:MAG: DUF4158 domain-containing protein [Desulfuromonadales bacterium]
MAHPLVHPEEWLILPEEEQLLINRTPDGRLGFAVLLKFFQVKGRFPNRLGEVGKDIVASIAAQIGVPIEAWHDAEGFSGAESAYHPAYKPVWTF